MTLMPPIVPQTFERMTTTLALHVPKYRGVFEEDVEYDLALSQLKTLDAFLAVPLAVLGLVLNAVCLWVWQADPFYDSTILVFKCLALWDAAFTGLGIVWLLLPLRYHYDSYGVGEMMLWHVGNVCQFMTVYVTVVLVLVRLQTVSRSGGQGGGPRTGSTSRRKLLLANVILLVLGVSLEGLETLAKETIAYRLEYFYFKRFFALWLPLVPMVVLLGLLAFRVCREGTDEVAGTTSSQPITVSSDTVSNTSIPPISTRREPVRITRRLTTLVFWISGYTILAYTTWFIYKTIELTLFRASGDAITKFYLWLFVLLKSVINPVFYTALSPCFRHLLRSRLSQMCLSVCKCCCHRCQVARGSNVGDMPLMEMQE